MHTFMIYAYKPIVIDDFVICIMLICPCTVDPLSRLHSNTLGFAGVNSIFLFLPLNIDCWYSSSDPPTGSGSSKMCPQSTF